MYSCYRLKDNPELRLGDVTTVNMNIIKVSDILSEAICLHSAVHCAGRI